MAFRGGFEPLPVPLGGDGGREGINAAQHGRICSDLVSAWRTLPLAVVWSDDAGELTAYLSRAGCGVSHPHAPTVVRNSEGNYTITWAASYENDVGIKHSWSIRSVVGSSASVTFVQPLTVSTNSLTIETRDAVAGTVADSAFQIEVFGEWGPRRAIGDYAGAVGKKDDTKEHPIPYAAQIYHDLKQQRGSAYSDRVNTFVHAENLSIARAFASTGFRLPEKFRNNAIGPAKADEGLVYWSRVLGLGQRPGETKPQFRARMAIHAKPGIGATYDNLVSECSTLLGDAFVGITLNYDDEFETPPTNTYWPVINPGPSTYDLGPGAWLTERSQIIINVEQPPGVPDGEFHQLVNVELFELIDRLIPIWSTAQWRDPSTERIVWDGGAVWDGVGVEWDNLFDWNS